MVYNLGRLPTVTHNHVFTRMRLHLIHRNRLVNMARVVVLCNTEWAKVCL